MAVFSVADHPINPPSYTGKPYLLDIPPSSQHAFRIHRGVYQVFTSTASMQAGEPAIHYGIDREQFWKDYQTMWIMMLDGPLYDEEIAFWLTIVVSVPEKGRYFGNMLIVV